MKMLRAILGYMIAGMIVMSVWGAFSGSYGIIGGYFAAFIIIGPMWYMNHYVGLIPNEDGNAFIDMAVGIAICGIVRDGMLKGWDTVIDSLPTLALVTIGAILAGIIAAKIEENMGM
ncbi:hypothetical protein SAMN05421767_1508 [Granulicatella balaenopterae]|uniref:Uncharacterized protein n=1 Tax=Granulicatella balaenopterae TaxID=137733 RepID=A0A1H9P571_9LACT|nr:hypothetical protein [Granulicatella balaenopterae]SER42713.1 hypothetical protein SAMN05421767_1508 [Granulicatella balaenopterae]